MIDLKDQMALGGVSRHETFTPRYGWLKKGYEAAKDDRKVFTAPDCIERLGVGKNMVRSIRYWCLAFHLLEYEDGEERKGQRGVLKPTSLANQLLHDHGWDPHLEDVASLWFLHWQLFLPPFHAASWPLVFNYSLPTFDLKHLSMAIVFTAKQYDKLSALSENSFEKDASCLIRMYADGNSEAKTDLDSPFAQLNLLRSAEEPNTYRFVTSEKRTLPSLIFAACCFSYADLTQPNQRTLGLHKIVFGFNSPGIIFKISETDTGRLLEDAASRMKGMEFVESMGNRQLQFDKAPTDLFHEALDLYYETVKTH